MRAPLVSGLVLLSLRGVLLWIVVPIGSLSWVAFWPLMRRNRIGLAQFIGWVDLNLVAGLQRSILRPLVRHALPWTPVAALPGVTHRVGWIDPV